MNIQSINTCTFTSNNNNERNICLLYPVVQGIGAAAGYNIPIRDIDIDIASPSRKGLALMQKAKAPNTLGKWKNALAGAFIGTAVAMAVDYFSNNKNKTNQTVNK